MLEQDIQYIISDLESDDVLSKHSISVDYRDVICANTFAMIKYVRSESISNKYRDVKTINNELNDLYVKLNKNLTE